MLFYGLDGPVSSSLRQPGSGSSTEHVQYTSTLSAPSSFLTTFSSSRVGRRQAATCGSSAAYLLFGRNSKPR